MQDLLLKIGCLVVAAVWFIRAALRFAGRRLPKAIREGRTTLAPDMYRRAARLSGYSCALYGFAFVGIAVGVFVGTLAAAWAGVGIALLLIIGGAVLDYTSHKLARPKNP